MAISTIDTSSISGLGYGFKNRILNGGMVIDQRNAGASVTINTDAKNYVMDRFWAFDNTEGVFTLQQVSDAPAGFVNSAKATVTTADASVTNDQYSGFSQLVEGLNCADLAWGTASAATVTLSFWVKSSLTGTFGGSVRNSAFNRSYPFSYTISSANTWEQKSITIAGDTSGTWLTTNGIGININWSIAEGPNRVGTAGVWAGANYAGATGQTQIISTLNATWQITGVQLEKGTVATSFDYRPYGTELALCQRYFYQASARPMSVYCGPTYGYNCIMSLPVTMRAAPTLASGATWTVSAGSAGVVALGSGTGGAAAPDAVQLYNSSSNWTTNVSTAINAGFSAEL